MLFKEIIVVYTENYTYPWIQISGLVIVKADDIYVVTAQL
jgi:hypothetical protein